MVKMIKPITHHRYPMTEFTSLLKFGENRGVEIYLVGGCLRDQLLHRVPDDWDFIVEGEGIPFARGFAQEIGGRFLILDEEIGEGRVIQQQSSAVNNHRSAAVYDFIGLKGKPLEKELERRDFRINAMAIRLRDFLKHEARSVKEPDSGSFVLPVSRCIIDLFEGRKDLQGNKIRLIREDGFERDPLRILRAFRFACHLDFEIPEEILEKMEFASGGLKKIAPERIHSEIFSILSSPNSSQNWRRCEESLRGKQRD